MLVPNQIIEVKITPSNIIYYKELGYNVQLNKTSLVQLKDLSKGSNYNIKLICDSCNNNFDRQWKEYNRSHKSEYSDSKDYCTDCTYEKVKNTNNKKYGVSHILSLPEVRNKIKNTCQILYNGDSPNSSPVIKEKTKNTNIERFGVEFASQNSEIKEKVRLTLLKNYGVEYMAYSPELQLKAKETLMNNYGVENPSQSDIVREKINNTFTKNGTCKTSSQQIELHKMIQEKYPEAIINYPCGNSILDIALILANDIKIDIEYDCWYWHKNQERDKRRDYYHMRRGWKILRVKSAIKLPYSEELFNAIDYLINTEHHHKDIILDDWKDVAI